MSKQFKSFIIELAGMLLIAFALLTYGYLVNLMTGHSASMEEFKDMALSLKLTLGIIPGAMLFIGVSFIISAKQ